MAYANVFKPNGGIPFDEAQGSASKQSRPVPNIRSAGLSSGTNLANASTDLAIGDFYAIDANGNAYRAGPGDAIKGLCTGFDMQGNPAVYNGQGAPSVNYISGAPLTGAWPNLIGVEDDKCSFEIQADSCTLAQVGSIFNLKDAAPDPKYHISQQSLTTAFAGTQFKIVKIKNSPADNAAGTNARVIVQCLTMAA